MKKIYVLGSLNMDLVIETPYMPQAGETILGKNFKTCAGGKGANQAMACGRLGGRVAMCGVVGEDAFGQTLIENLSQNGVDVSCLRKTPGPTGVAVILIENGDNRIILDAGANGKVTEADVDYFLSTAKKDDIFLTQLECPIPVIGYALREAKKREMFTILNPAPANRGIIPYLQFVDLITPNESELQIFGGISTLRETGIPVILTTLGGNGYEITKDGISVRYPCMRVQVVDTTAAGDTLCGGLAVGLSEGRNLEDSARFGSIAASIACTRLGAQPSIPSREEVSMEDDI